MIVPTAQSPVPDPDRPTILYVEDEVLLRAAAADEMRQAGFMVREAGTVGEAMAVVESPVPLDALITDIRLPGEMDGMDLACLAHRLRPALKIVAASAYIPDWPTPELRGSVLWQALRRRSRRSANKRTPGEQQERVIRKGDMNAYS